MATVEPRPLATSIDAYIKRDEPDELPLLADDIRELHSRVQKHAGKALAYALEAGELLVKAKSLIPYGSWETWLRANCTPMSITIARIYMRLHTYKSEIEAAGADSIRHAMDVCAGLPNQSGFEEQRTEVRKRKQEDPFLTVRQLADEYGVATSTVQLWLSPRTNAIRKAQYRGRYKRKVVLCGWCGGKIHSNGHKAE